jgi:Arc/MetJ-type ribon-helix-helix transcriptional regulator
MKLSVSLSGDDVAFLDEYAVTHQCASRSAAVHRAIQALRLGELRESYGEAWAEWERNGERSAWDVVDHALRLHLAL